MLWPKRDRETGIAMYEIETDSRTQRMEFQLSRQMGQGLGKLLYMERIKKQDPTVQHREVYSVSHDKNNGREYIKNVYV